MAWGATLKPKNDFKEAIKAYEAAVAARDAAVAAADKLRGPLVETAAMSITADDSATKTQLADIQTAADALKASAGKVSAQNAAVDVALANLQKVSNPLDPKPPEDWTLNTDLQALAMDQYQLDLAKAVIPLEGAHDAFSLKLAELKGHVPLHNLPGAGNGAGKVSASRAA